MIFKSLHEVLKIFNLKQLLVFNMYINDIKSQIV